MEELVTYIQTSLNNHTSRIDIENKLRASGWSDSDINTAFTKVMNQRVTISFLELFRYTFQKFKRLWKRFLVILILEIIGGACFEVLKINTLPVIPFKTSNEYFYFFTLIEEIKTTSTSPLVSIGSTIFLYVILNALIKNFFLICYLLIIREQEKLNVSLTKDIFLAASKFILPLIFLDFLYYAALTIGLIALILPGIYILFFWFFYPYVLIFENIHGIKAFNRSKRLIQRSGNPLNVIALILIGSLITSFIPLISTFIAMLYFHTLYEYLRTRNISS